ncbi:hypothetical protein Tco_0228300 [Tanacetum coccineum]
MIVNGLIRKFGSASFQQMKMLTKTEIVALLLDSGSICTKDVESLKTFVLEETEKAAAAANAQLEDDKDL